MGCQWFKIGVVKIQHACCHMIACDAHVSVVRDSIISQYCLLLCGMVKYHSV